MRAGRGSVSQLRNRVLFCRFTRMYIPPAEIRHGHVLARQCCLDRFEACFGEETLSLSSTREFHQCAILAARALLVWRGRAGMKMGVDKGNHRVLSSLIPAECRALCVNGHSPADAAGLHTRLMFRSGLSPST